MLETTNFAGTFVSSCSCRNLHQIRCHPHPRPRPERLICRALLSRNELKGAGQADLASCGKGRYGGASTAAAFLQNFVEENTAWSHIDIAGPAMYSQARDFMPKDGTGFGAQLLHDYVNGVSANTTET